MRDGIIMHRADRCPKCQTNTVEMYDDRNNPVQLSMRIDLNRMDDLIDHKKLVYMKCRTCKTVFTINWIDKDCIQPLYDESRVNKFISNFEQLNKR